MLRRRQLMVAVVGVAVGVVTLCGCDGGTTGAGTEDSASPTAVTPTFDRFQYICFAFVRGDPAQEALDFEQQFFEDGHFGPGIYNLTFDSSAAMLEVELKPGVSSAAWIDTVPSENLDVPVLDKWYFSDGPC